MLNNCGLTVRKDALMDGSMNENELEWINETIGTNG